MPIITPRDKEMMREKFKLLAGQVKLVNFTQQLECQFCTETRVLLEEIADTSESITLEVYNFQIDRKKVEQYGIDKIPATVVEGTKDFGIRFYGIPAGYETATLIEDIITVSQGDSGLSTAAREQLATLTAPVHIQVFITPTCPYCLQAVQLAHRAAIESDLIRADMVEAIEFPHLAHKYDVAGVPKTVINESTHVVGALPEAEFISHIVKAASASG